MDVEDDPVVKEIPIFLSKTLTDKLFMVQYPTHPQNDTFDNAVILKSSFKPESQEIHLEVAVDTQSDLYDHNKGIQFVLNAQSESKKDEDMFDSEIWNKTVMASSRSIQDCSNYAIGIFQDDELHITPLKGILRMRPQFGYLEKSDKRTPYETKTTGEDGDEEEENAAPVKVTFARHQPDHVKKMQEQSFQHHSKKSLEERWIQTTYVPAYDTQAELTRMEMFCSSSEESSNALNLTPAQYLNHLLKTHATEESLSRVPKNHTKSFNHVQTLPLLDQIRIIMKEANVMSFANLRMTLSTEHDTATVLKYLQQVALLVQGNWVVNSELIFPKDSYSSQSGISADVMCRARDYILLSFTEQQYLNRKTVSSIIKLPAAEIKEIFEKLCIHEPQKGWQLQVPPNWDFCDRYPEIAQRQEIFWEAKRKYLREAMEAQNQPPQRQRRKSNRESLGSENEERNVGRGRKSLSDNDGTEPGKPKKTSRSRKVSETTTT